MPKREPHHTPMTPAEGAAEWTRAIRAVIDRELTLAGSPPRIPHPERLALSGAISKAKG